MFRQLMRLKIHLCIEHDELLLLTFPICTEEVILSEMILQSVVVSVVVRMSRISSVAEETTLVLHPTMIVQLIVVVESFTAESTQGMAFEACLICRARLVISPPHMLLQLFVGKKLVFVSEDTLVPGAQIAHALLVCRFDMAMKIRPA